MQDLKTTILGVGCMVVPHNCDDKAISAQLSWRLTGWLGLSLAMTSTINCEQITATRDKSIINQLLVGPPLARVDQSGVG